MPKKKEKRKRRAESWTAQIIAECQEGGCGWRVSDEDMPKEYITSYAASHAESKNHAVEIVKTRITFYSKRPKDLP